MNIEYFPISQQNGKHSRSVPLHVSSKVVFQDVKKDKVECPNQCFSSVFTSVIAARVSREHMSHKGPYMMGNIAISTPGVQMLSMVLEAETLVACKRQCFHTERARSAHPHGLKVFGFLHKSTHALETRTQLKIANQYHTYLHQKF